MGFRTASPRRLDAGGLDLPFARASGRFGPTYQGSDGPARRVGVGRFLDSARSAGDETAVTLLISARRLADRRHTVSTALAPLAVSLAAELRTAMDRPLYVPEQKALLS